MAQLILSQIEGQSLYKVYVQPGQEYLLYGKVTTPAATSTYTLREVSVTGQVLTNEQTTISTSAGLQEFSKVFTTSGATVMLIIALTNAEVLELSLDGPPGVVLITTPVEKTLKHVSQFDVLISYLDYAFEVKISRKLNGDWRLTCALPLDDEKGQELVNENFIEYDGQKYVVKAVKDDDVKKIRMIEAEHVGLGLIDYWLADTLDLPSVSATVALAAILEGTPYTLGTVNVAGANNLEAEIMNKLAAVKKVVDTWGGELDFDNYEVSLVQQMGQDNGIQFRKGKNLSGIVRTLDTKTLTTKLYGYGKDNLVITGLDTTGWTDEQKAGLTIVDNLVTQPYLVSDYLSSYAKEYQGEFRDSDIEDQQELLTAMREALAEQEIPRVTYEVSVVDLSGLAQYVGEGFALGDTVKVIDEDLSIEVQARIVEYDKYPFEPWRDKAVLANFGQNLHDYLANNLSTMKETFDRFVTRGKVSTNWLAGIINSMQNQISSSSGKLVWNDDSLEAIEIDEGGEETGRKVKLTPGGIWVKPAGEADYVGTAITGEGIASSLLIGGTIVATDSIYLGDETFALDAANRRIEIKDTLAIPITRVILGNNGPDPEDYGLWVYDVAGNLVVSADGLGLEVVGTDQIQDLAITNAKVGNLEITGAKIANATIGNAKISDLSASKIDTGTLNVGAGGVTVQTAASGARLVLNSTGLKIYDAGDVNTVAINSDGSASFTGSIESGSSITGATITGSTLTTATSGTRVAIGTGGSSLADINIFHGASNILQILDGIDYIRMHSPDVDLYLGKTGHDTFPEGTWDFSGATVTGLPAGSTDADTLDGHDSSYFATSTHDHGGSTGTNGTHNHGIPDGTVLMVDGGGTVTWTESGAHPHSIGTP